MISRRTLPEIFIETLTDMLREERENKASRLSSQMKARTKRFLQRLPLGGDESLIAVDRFSHMPQDIWSYGEPRRNDLVSSGLSQDRGLQE